MSIITCTGCGQKFDGDEYGDSPEFDMHTCPSLETHPYKTGWKEIVESQPIPESWDNTSWGNDGCPSFSHKGLHIWVDHVDPEERENVDTTRYAIHLDYDTACSGGDVLIKTDDFDELVQFVNDFTSEKETL